MLEEKLDTSVNETAMTLEEYKESQWININGITHNKQNYGIC